MTETFKSLIGNHKRNLKIAEQTFSDEIISNKTLYSSAFIKLIFFNCSFHKVNFVTKLILMEVLLRNVSLMDVRSVSQY